MSSIRGELVSETFGYDGGREVRVYVPPVPPEAVVYAGDGQLISQWGGPAACGTGSGVRAGSRLPRYSCSLSTSHVYPQTHVHRTNGGASTRDGGSGPPRETCNHRLHVIG